MQWMARRATLALVALIGVLLPALAALQYRWMGEISRLEQVRARTNIDAAAQRFSMEFDEMLAAIYARYYGHLPPDTVPATDGAASESAAPPPLVTQVLMVSRNRSGGFTLRELGPHGWQTAGGPATWPAWLDLTPTRSTQDGAVTSLPAVLRRTLLDEVPALVIRRDGRQDDWIVVVLDLQRIVNDVLPRMLAGWLEGGVPVQYDVLVNREDVPQQVLYRSRDGLTPDGFDGWVTLMPVFGLHSRDLEPEMAKGLMPDAAAHRWRLFIKPQDGSLEAAVATARRRNLWIGASVLALLALSVGLLVFAANRVQRTARESLELVARISHELRTPLATITCAGENLADNVVANAEETRNYGRIIQQEGRRLHKTISDILLCCRLQTRSGTVLSLRPTRVDDVIDKAIEDSRVVAAPAADIQRAIEPGLPLVLADADALRAAVKNLIVNALRHGQQAPVRVSARADRAGQVVIEVEDHGPGIPDDELPRVFDAFFRGKRAQQSQLDGSGIGLSVVYQVVRSHGGRVRISRAEPHGTRFTVHVPGLPLAALSSTGSVA
jgi:signal transduction histidine kinase